MRRVLCSLVCCLVTASPTRVAAQTAKDSVIAVVNEFFRAMTARDTAAFSRTQMPDGLAYAVRDRGDSVVIRRQTFEASVSSRPVVRRAHWGRFARGPAVDEWRVLTRSLPDAGHPMLIRPPTPSKPRT